MPKLVWKDEFLGILSTIDQKPLALRKNVHLATSALLELLCEGHQPTPAQVVDQVYLEYAPPGGWVMFDRRKWLEYIPLIERALASSDPRSVLKL